MDLDDVSNSDETVLESTKEDEEIGELANAFRVILKV
jgi:hypothetical protein